MSKFKVWIDDDKVVAGNNVMTSDVLNDDVQRINGFKSGTDVSSIRVNSIIRQNSLVSKALMEISGDNTLDATSSVNNVIAILKKSDNNTVSFTQADALNNVTSGEKLSTSFGKISKQFDSLSTFMKEDESGAKLYASSDTTKGTIEERLNNLGFEEGSFILASGVTATTNYIKKQGNIIYFKLVFDGVRLDIDNVPYRFYGQANKMVATLPSSFIIPGTVKFPVKTVINARSTAVAGSSVDAYSEFEISGRSCVLRLFAKNTVNTAASATIFSTETNTFEGCYVLSEPGPNTISSGPDVDAPETGGTPIN